MASCSNSARDWPVRYGARQCHYLIAAALQRRSDDFSFVEAARVEHIGVGQPVGGDHHHVGRERIDLASIRPQFAGLGEPFAQAAGNLHLLREQLLELDLERAIVGEQVIEVAVKEAVLPDQLEQHVQEQPSVLDVGFALGGQRQQLVDLPLELLEDAVDDVVFVLEVVVQIARGDVHLLGDQRRVDVGLAEIVEEPQRKLEDAFARAARRLAFHGSARIDSRWARPQG